MKFSKSITTLRGETCGDITTIESSKDAISNHYLLKQIYAILMTSRETADCVHSTVCFDEKHDLFSKVVVATVYGDTKDCQEITVNDYSELCQHADKRVYICQNKQRLNIANIENGYNKVILFVLAIKHLNHLFLMGDFDITKTDVLPSVFASKVLLDTDTLQRNFNNFCDYFKVLESVPEMLSEYEASNDPTQLFCLGEGGGIPPFISIGRGENGIQISLTDLSDRTKTLDITGFEQTSNEVIKNFIVVVVYILTIASVNQIGAI